MTLTALAAIEIVNLFDPGQDDLARKSQELVLGLLHQSRAPFSRDQFDPGHITSTALVIHPTQPLVLMMYHHRLHRWLLPGGHVEEPDVSLAATAAREAREETEVQLDPSFEPVLAGIDVHGIPPKRDEPYHLHHDLIWCFRAVSKTIEQTEEAPQVMWAAEEELIRLHVTESIRRSTLRCKISGRAA
jgi:8-oxo-dGTP pyrophosphatase MutT (NUDIX family)